MAGTLDNLALAFVSVPAVGALGQSLGWKMPPRFPRAVAEEKASESPATKWPWGTHTTELLGHLVAAGQCFYGLNFDPSDNFTASTNDVVSAWLQERGVSQRMVDAIATILRPDGLPTGPRT